MKWLMLAGLFGCGGPPPVATAADADRAHVQLAQLTDGRALLLKKCGGCHDVPKPADQPREKWPTHVALMQVYFSNLFLQYVLNHNIH